MNSIKYQSGYKYQLTCQYNFNLPAKFSFKKVDTRYIGITSNVRLVIEAGYAWDGPSGPTVDTKNFMRGSVVHDALYQLIREGHLPRSQRKYADELLRKMCREDGMSRLRAWWVYRGVRLFAGKVVLPSNRRPIKVAP